MTEEQYHNFYWSDKQGVNRSRYLIPPPLSKINVNNFAFGNFGYLNFSTALQRQKYIDLWNIDGLMFGANFTTIEDWSLNAPYVLYCKEEPKSIDPYRRDNVGNRGNFGKYGY